MSPNAHSEAMDTSLGFLDLPPELRLMVYKHLSGHDLLRWLYISKTIRQDCASTVLPKLSIVLYYRTKRSNTVCVSPPTHDDDPPSPKPQMPLVFFRNSWMAGQLDRFNDVNMSASAATSTSNNTPDIWFNGFRTSGGELKMLITMAEGNRRRHYVIAVTARTGSGGTEVVISEPLGTVWFAEAFKHTLVEKFRSGHVDYRDKSQVAWLERLEEDFRASAAKLGA